MSRSIAAAFTLVVTVSAAAQVPFKFEPHGVLKPGSGRGRSDTRNHAPGMRFPVELAPAFANSQVWNPGGQHGGRGGQCSASNYTYPWQDNYCETRSWPIALCPSGAGHQGQDIRPATCAKDQHWAVAVADGTVSHIGSYSLYLYSEDGNTRYDYLHMSGVAVKVGTKVKKGTRLGRISNVFQQGASTTIHLHFNIRRNLPELGWTFVPPYAALIDAYQRLQAGQP